MSVSGLLIGTAAEIGFLIYYFIMYLVTVYNWHTVDYWSIHFPLFSWFNWINILFALCGFTLSLVGIIKGRRRFLGIAGLIICTSILIFSCLEVSLPDIHWTEGAMPDVADGSVR